jgi:LytS/YehU family sensor histidine kinase
MLYFYTVQVDSPGEGFNYGINTTLSYALIIYGNALWLMPRLYKKKRYFTYWLIVILGLLSITWLRIQSQTYMWNHFINPREAYKPQLRGYLFTIITHTLVFIFSIAFRFTLDFFSIRDQQEKLLKQHAEAQLNLLKAQVQPHFLFNTLNNIYFIAQRESPVTADLLEKLSSIMRYFLDQGPQSRILLSTELDFIRNYVELEKMRIRYPVDINFSLSGDIDHTMIPPMLLIPLVENVFKHGIDKSKENNYIEITLRVTERLYFEVVNNTGDEPFDKGKGTGLKNLSDRLSILYGEDFELRSGREGAIYTSRLNIPL